MLKQRLCGLVLLILSILVILIAMTGKTTADRDCTALLFLVPLGFYLFFSKTKIMY